jgi:hypothetical protein
MWGDHDDTDEQNALRKVEDNDGSLSEFTLTLMRRPQIAHIDRLLTDSSCTRYEGMAREEGKGWGASRLRELAGFLVSCYKSIWYQQDP